MTLPRFAIPSLAAIRLRAVACLIVWWATGLGVPTLASEVISAIPGKAQPPITPSMVVDTIEAGTRGPGPAPQHGCAERCHGGTCAHGHCGHAGCRHGSCGVPGCPAHCPVRPASFGFYGTQWRTWPGQEVVQAAHVEPAAPVMPPKSEVPTADEESPVQGFELPAPEPEGTPEQPSSDMPPEPARTESVPAEPAPLPAPKSRPKAGKPAVPAEDNLFDEAALRRRSQERLAVLRQEAVHQERLRTEALRQQAQRLVRLPSATGTSLNAAPSAGAVLPVDRLVGAAPLPVPELEQEGRPTLKQALHAEPEARGLRDAVRKPLPGNPLR